MLLRGSTRTEPARRTRPASAARPRTHLACRVAGPTSVSAHRCSRRPAARRAGKERHAAGAARRARRGEGGRGMTFALSRLWRRPSGRDAAPRRAARNLPAYVEQLEAFADSDSPAVALAATRLLIGLGLQAPSAAVEPPPRAEKADVVQEEIGHPRTGTAGAARSGRASRTPRTPSTALRSPPSAPCATEGCAHRRRGRSPRCPCTTPAREHLHRQALQLLRPARQTGPQRRDRLRADASHLRHRVANLGFTSSDLGSPS